MPGATPTTAEAGWLENEHAGQMLVTEFLEPEAISVAQLAEKVGVGPQHITSVIDGARPMDAELDLRLGRYFGMSEGFFLRLQDQYELLEAKRRLNGELDRILPRAA
jgi:antitoxin HigA-1